MAGFLESFLKDKLKKPSKRINGHLHRVQHFDFDFDLLTRVLAVWSCQTGIVPYGVCPSILWNKLAVFG